MRSLFPFLLLPMLVACGAETSTPDAATPNPVAETPPAEVPVATSPALVPGGLEMPNPGTPFEGVLTGGQPATTDFTILARTGYKTVINLRRAEEEGQAAEPEAVAAAGLTYVHLPIAGAEDLNEDNARRLRAALDEAERPLLLHCGSSNRVGALLALGAYWIDGLPADEALALGRAGGMTRLEETVVARIDADQAAGE